MLSVTLALLLGLSPEANVVPCAERDQALGDHITDVCTDWLDSESDVAYSATMRASLMPRPASRQVMVYRKDGEWFMRVAGYRWERGTSLVTTRRNEMAISPDDAARIENALGTAALARLAAQPFYGSDDVICTDGADLELAAAIDGLRHAASQHSCAGETEMNAISAVFRDIALTYDSGFEGYLGGL